MSTSASASESESEQSDSYADSGEKSLQVRSLREYCTSATLTSLEALPEEVLDGLIEALRKKRSTQKAECIYFCAQTWLQGCEKHLLSNLNFFSLIYCILRELKADGPEIQKLLFPKIRTALIYLHLGTWMRKQLEERKVVDPDQSVGPDSEADLKLPSLSQIGAYRGYLPFYTGYSRLIETRLIQLRCSRGYVSTGSNS